MGDGQRLVPVSITEARQVERALLHGCSGVRGADVAAKQLGAHIRSHSIVMIPSEEWESIRALSGVESINSLEEAIARASS